MAALEGAVESAAPVSRLHLHQSFEVADFPVPTGREEEWRFTPLRRLRGLQGDTVLPECKATVEPIPHPEVAASRAERGIAGAAAPTWPPTGPVPALTRPSGRRQ